MISRFNNGVQKAAGGALFGLFGSCAKAILPTRLVGIQQADAANIVAALALGKFLFGLLDYDKKNGSITRNALGASATFGWADIFMATTAPVLAFLTEGSREHKENIRNELVINAEYKFLLNLVVSLGENVTASLLGHGALALMGCSTFSLQQAAVDAAVATVPSILPTRWM